MNKLKKLIIVFVLFVCVFLFTGSTENYKYKQYKVNGYTDEPNFQLILDDYKEYISICDKYGIDIEYSEKYFETQSLVLFHVRGNSGSYDYSVENVSISDDQYIVTIKKDVPLIGDCMMKNYFIMLEENDDVLNNINEIVVEEVKNNLYS